MRELSLHVCISLTSGRGPAGGGGQGSKRRDGACGFSQHCIRSPSSLGSLGERAPHSVQGPPRGVYTAAPTPTGIPTPSCHFSPLPFPSLWSPDSSDFSQIIPGLSGLHLRFLVCTSLSRSLSPVLSPCLSLGSGLSCSAGLSLCPFLWLVRNPPHFPSPLSGRLLGQDPPRPARRAPASPLRVCRVARRDTIKHLPTLPATPRAAEDSVPAPAGSPGRRPSPGVPHALPCPGPSPPPRSAAPFIMRRL